MLFDLGLHSDISYRNRWIKGMTFVENRCTVSQTHRGDKHDGNNVCSRLLAVALQRLTNSMHSQLIQHPVAWCLFYILYRFLTCVRTLPPSYRRPATRPLYNTFRRAELRCQRSMTYDIVHTISSISPIKLAFRTPLRRF